MIGIVRMHAVLMALNNVLEMENVKIVMVQLLENHVKRYVKAVKEDAIAEEKCNYRENARVHCRCAADHADRRGAVSVSGPGQQRPDAVVFDRVGHDYSGHGAVYRRVGSVHDTDRHPHRRTDDTLKKAGRDPDPELCARRNHYHCGAGPAGAGQKRSGDRHDRSDRHRLRRRRTVPDDQYAAHFVPDPTEVASGFLLCCDLRSGCLFRPELSFCRV